MYDHQEKIISEINNIITPTLRHRIGVSTFSKEINEMLNDFFLRISECHKLWLSNKQTIISTLRHIKKADLFTKIESDYTNIPLELRESIETKCEKQYSCEIVFTNRRFRIFFCTTPEFDESKIVHSIRLIYTWLCFANKYIDPQCSKEVNIFLFLITDKKHIPHSHGEHVNTKHANTAFTYSCLPSLNIVIYRLEEWFRTLIHETFHSFGFDFIRMGQSKISARENEIKRVIPVNVNDLRIYETYCEMWAEILNVMFYIYETHPPEKGKKIPIRQWRRLFSEYMFYERVFSLCQCVKILNHNNISYSTLPTQAHLYKENTYVFSYFVLKTILSVHLKDFLSFCAEQHRTTKKTMYSVQFRMTHLNLNKFTHLFTTLFNSHMMLYGTSVVSKYMDTYQNEFKKTHFNKNLRMTLIEIDL
jgi:hypothetical protein